MKNIDSSQTEDKSFKAKNKQKKIDKDVLTDLKNARLGHKLRENLKMRKNQERARKLQKKV